MKAANLPEESCRSAVIVAVPERKAGVNETHRAQSQSVGQNQLINYNSQSACQVSAINSLSGYCAY